MISIGNSHFKSALLLLVVLCGCNQNESNEIDKTDIEKEGIVFHELKHGIGSSQNVKVVDDMLDPGGQDRSGDKFIIMNIIDTVPCKIGSEFGITYNVTSNTSKEIELTRVWIFPSAMTNTLTHKKYDRIVRTSWYQDKKSSYYCYKLEDSFELLKGDWKLRIYYKHHLLHSHHFYIH